MGQERATSGDQGEIVVGDLAGGRRAPPIQQRLSEEIEAGPPAAIADPQAFDRVDHKDLPGSYPHFLDGGIAEQRAILDDLEAARGQAGNPPPGSVRDGKVERDVGELVDDRRCDADGGIDLGQRIAARLSKEQQGQKEPAHAG